jgi:nucleoside-diphosphate-sugar epimerase
MRLDDGRMIPGFIAEAIRSQPITIHGSKDDAATYLYVSDALEGMTRMMASKEIGPINIGNPEEMTIGGIAEHIIALTGARPDVRMELPLPYDAKQAIPSVRQAREMLGWFPVVPLDEGLKRTIEYMRGLRNVNQQSFGLGESVA